MDILIRSLNITNFKGIKEQLIEFDPKVTSIYGDNEAGKTTVTDAWHWLLTNKNSSDEKDFNIKNTVHTDLNRAEHQVVAKLMADGMTIELKKVFKEKWEKKRGTEETVFTGHETLYYYNDVPCTQKEYQKKISDIIPEDALKMITNPLYFNCGVKWQDRRNVLLTLAGKISDDEIFAAVDQPISAIDNLRMVLASGKTIAEYKREIGSRKKKINDDLKAIPSRIDEVKRAIPRSADYNAIEAEIKAKGDQIQVIESSINDKNQHYQAEYKKVQDHQNSIHKAKTRKNEIWYEAQSRLNNSANGKKFERNGLADNVSKLEQDLKSKTLLMRSRSQAKKDLAERTDGLRQEWHKVNQSDVVFDDHQFTCPTCRRAYEADNIEETKETLLANFLENKTKELDKINDRGRLLVAETNQCDSMIEQLGKAITGLENDLKTAKEKLSDFDAIADAFAPSLDEVLADNEEYVQLSAQIASLEGAVPQVQTADVSSLTAQKATLQAEIDALRKELNSREQIERANKRVAELETEERTLAQQLADLERNEFLIDDFNRSKMDIMESRINGLFEQVTFKLFDRQINGGEVETCETMFKGVPFSDLNTAGKVQAGIDIINTLSKHYNVSAPIFLDNQESVTKLPETESQVIKLIVSEPDKILRVA